MRYVYLADTMSLRANKSHKSSTQTTFRNYVNKIKRSVFSRQPSVNSQILSQSPFGDCTLHVYGVTITLSSLYFFGDMTYD